MGNLNYPDDDNMNDNCWEIKQCHREPGGENAHLGVCPVFLATSYDGINHGKLAGRMCWFVSGTFCNGEVQGTFAQKKLSCMTCEVYKQIKQEEKHDFMVTITT